MSPCNLANPQQGQVLVKLGGKDVILCVTLKALAQLEGHFHVDNFQALAIRLSSLNAGDLMVVLTALIIDDVDLSALNIGLPEAILAVVKAFEAMND